VQIVNGYLCMNCCDVDRAREGKDPHQSTNQIQKQIEQRLHPLAPRNFGPDVIFGGSVVPSDGGNGANSGNGDSWNASVAQAAGSAPSQEASGFNLIV